MAKARSNKTDLIELQTQQSSFGLTFDSLHMFIGTATHLRTVAFFRPRFGGEPEGSPVGQG